MLSSLSTALTAKALMAKVCAAALVAGAGAYTVTTIDDGGTPSAEEAAATLALDLGDDEAGDKPHDEKDLGVESSGEDGAKPGPGEKDGPVGSDGRRFSQHVLGLGRTHGDRDHFTL